MVSLPPATEALIEHLISLPACDECGAVLDGDQCTATYDHADTDEGNFREGTVAAQILEAQGIRLAPEAQENPQSLADVLIEDGLHARLTLRQQQRSQWFRSVALPLLGREENSRIPCSACGFDFEKKHDRGGTNFIELHHIDLLRFPERENMEAALTKVAALCSNCHRMIHREPGSLLSIEDLRKRLSNS